MATVLQKIKDAVNKASAQSTTISDIASGNHRWPAPAAPAPVVDVVASAQPAARPAATSVTQSAPAQATTQKSRQPAQAAPQPDQSAMYNAYAQALAEQNRLLQLQYDLQEKQRRANLDATLAANNRQAEDSMRQAYIARMLAQKGMPQLLKASGVSGGLAETLATDMENTYSNNRTAIDKARLAANSKAQQAFANGTANDFSQYLTGQYNLTKSALSRAKGTNSPAALQSLMDFYANMGLSESRIRKRLEEYGVL